MKRVRNIVVLLCLISFGAIGNSYAGVYLTKKEALKLVFPSSDKVGSEKRGGYTFYIGSTSGNIDGYAVILHELGKHLPITFIVAIGSDGSIKDVHVMSFWEIRGNQVRERRFLRQYIGKKKTDTIELGRDIDSISGATLSCRAANIAVKRALKIWQESYKYTPHPNLLPKGEKENKDE